MRLCRLGGACATTAAMAALFAPAALACNEPRLDGGSISPRVAGPGDPVTVSIPDTEEGATYRLVLSGGQVAAEGTDGTREPGFVTSFAMPDLGDAQRAVSIRLDVSHEGGTWADEATIQYRPAPVEPASSQQPAAAAQPAPPAAVHEAPRHAAPSSGAPAPPSRPGGQAESRARPRRTTRREPSGRARGRVEPSTSASTAAPGLAAPVPARVEVSRGAAPAAVGRPAAPSARRTRAAVRPQAVIVPRVGDDKVMPRAVPRAAAAPPLARARDRWDPTGVLVLLAILGAGGLGWVAWRRRRSGNDPPDPRRTLEIEAELQEIIAEQRAAEAVPPERTRTPH